MSKKFVVDHYFKLLALNKAIMLTKFARDPVDPILSGSPFIADMINEIQDILAEIELERGDPEAQNKRMALRNNVRAGNEIWQICLNRVVEGDNSPWNAWTVQEKEDFSRIIFSPFIIEGNLLYEFISDVERLLKGNL